MVIAEGVQGRYPKDMNTNPLDDSTLSQFTKELVSAQLKSLQDPCVVAAGLLKKTLSVALKDLPPGSAFPAAPVESACQGAMMALLLGDQNLPKGAVCILEAVSELALEVHLDPTMMMWAALRGIADIRRFASQELLIDLRYQIELRFMGAGDALHQVLIEAEAREWREKAS